MSARTIVDELETLLGVPVVMFPIGEDGKPVENWELVAVETCMKDEEWRQILVECDLGVRLGGASSGICVLHFADEAKLKQFKELNPFANSTLLTHGDGYDLWVQVKGEYPDCQEIPGCGVWKADGAFAVIHLREGSVLPLEVIFKCAPHPVFWNEIRWPGNAPLSAVKKDLPAEPAPASQVEVSGPHSFPLKIARLISVNAAILLQYIAYRAKNSTIQRHGNPWFFSPISKIARQYPYLGRTAIFKAIGGLRNAKLIEAGVFNKLTFDRTLWYTVPATTLEKLEDDAKVSFDPNDAVHAKKHQISAVPAAMVLWNIKYWINENLKKNPHAEWYPLSPTALARHLPLVGKTIQRVLGKLEKSQIVQSKPKVDGITRGYRINSEYWKPPPLPDLDERGTNANIEGTERGSKRNMGGTNANMGGTNRNERGTNANDNTYYKPLQTPLEKPLQTSGGGDGSFLNSPDGKNIPTYAELAPELKPLDEPEFIDLQKLNREARDKLTSAALSNLAQAVRDYCVTQFDGWNDVLIRTFKTASHEKRLLREINKAVMGPPIDQKDPLVLQQALEFMALAVRNALQKQPIPSRSLQDEFKRELFDLHGALMREAKERKLAELNAQIEAEDKKNPYPDHEKQTDRADLSAADKVSLLRQIVQWQVNIQYERYGNKPYGLKWSKKTWKTAIAFFKRNPQATVAHILHILDYCHQIYWEKEPDPKSTDPFFYTRHGLQLDFFFKYLRTIIQENNIQADFPEMKFPEEG